MSGASCHHFPYISVLSLIPRRSGDTILGKLAIDLVECRAFGFLDVEHISMQPNQFGLRCYQCMSVITVRIETLLIHFQCLIIRLEARLRPNI